MATRGSRSLANFKVVLTMMKINWTEVFSAVSGTLLVGIASFLFQANNTLISVSEKVTNFNTQIESLRLENRDLEVRIRQLENDK